jgi:hypothetical protein
MDEFEAEIGELKKISVGIATTGKILVPFDEGFSQECNRSRSAVSGFCGNKRRIILTPASL